jgi:ABC-type spermidine/putrescine transport system permease subunit I
LLATKRSGPIDRLAEFFADHPRTLLSIQLAPPILFVSIFVFAPLASVFAWSFWKMEGRRLVPAFSTDAYAKFLGLGGETFWLDVFANSLRIAVTQTAVALVIGFAIAYFIGIKMRGSKYVLPLLLLFAVPFLTTYLMRTLSWQAVFSRFGLINTILLNLGLVQEPVTWLLFSEFAVHVGLLSTYLPFMIFPVWLAMSRIDPTVLAASSDLGATPKDTLFRIVIPLTIPGILIGSIFVFVGVLGDSVVPTTLGGPGGSRVLLANLMDRAIGGDDYPFAGAMASVTLLMAIGLILAWDFFFGLKKIGEI